ncbi:MAG: hypothetical protein ACO3A4_12595 [Silvanigrellaceae bacterium]
MINIILLSSLVSLVTIGILFIQRLNPETMRIPSYFLGVLSRKHLDRIKTKPPVWWELLAILLFTAGAALAYFSKQQDASSLRSKGDGLVWFDPTISHIRSLRASATAREVVLEKLKNLHLSEYLFIESGFQLNEEKIPMPTFELIKVPASGLEEHLLASLSKPTALSQPLDGRRLLQSLEKNYKLNVAETRLTLVTDAQAETLHPLASLASSFLSVGVILTPTSEADRKQVINRTPLVPEELAMLWQAANQENNSGVMPGTPQLLKIDPALAGRIPRQARPTLFLEDEDPGENESSKIPKLAIISSSESTGEETGNVSSGPAPLMTTCTLSVAGPSELDGLSDLRAYAQFFHVPIRPMSCRSTESSTSSNALDGSDPWKYRRASIWVVPVNETVAGELFQQGMYWTPEGFSPENDALVYIADTRLAGTETLLENIAVQLDANQPTVRLPLLPLPPAQLIFPWQLKGNGTMPRAKPISQTGVENSNVILKAADGTPMAFALSAQPPVVYLRTSGAAPNGELGRWGKWAGMWSTLSGRLKNNSPMLSVLQLRNPDEWTQWFEEQKQLQNPGFRYIIDGQNLKARIVEDKNSAIEPRPSLLIRERDDHMVLVEPPPSERISESLSIAEIEQLFPQSQIGREIENRETSSTSLFQWMGGCLAFFSIAALWFLQFKKHQQHLSGRTAALLLGILLSGFWAQPAFAQTKGRLPLDSRNMQRFSGNRPEIVSHPFRIGWCDATVPDPVRARYRQLQAMLAGRGTIELPSELTPGACRLGASEIWWTSSLEALQAAPVTQHIRSGGVVIAEGITLKQTPEWMLSTADPSIGLGWENPKRRGLLYRSFYLLSSFDGCSPERTLLLTLRKKVNAQSPMGIVTPARFLTYSSEGGDCFVGDDDYRSRSFINMMYALLTTDYKEDQMQLPEILNRVRNLGLEP